MVVRVAGSRLRPGLETWFYWLAVKPCVRCSQPRFPPVKIEIIYRRILSTGLLGFNQKTCEKHLAWCPDLGEAQWSC